MSEIRFENGQQVIERRDDVFEALSAEPRHQDLASLTDGPEGRTESLPEMAMTPDAPADPETLRRELHHRHLPKLASTGFVEWEADPLVASRGPRFAAIAAVVEALQSNTVALPDALVVGCRCLESECLFDRRD